MCRDLNSNLSCVVPRQQPAHIAVFPEIHPVVLWQVTTALQEVDTIHGPRYNARPLISPAGRTENDNEVLIELKDVHKSFGNKKILQGVNIKIRRGETVGIIGGSGTGKSTTLRLMAGLLAPDAVQSLAISPSWCWGSFPAARLFPPACIRLSLHST